MLLRTALLCAFVAAVASAQPFFECQVPTPAGAVPFTQTPDCEGVTSNAATLINLPFAGVEVTPSCGMPPQSLGYCYLQGHGPVTPNPPPGGPLPRPLAGVETEVQVPIPAGVTGITFWWEFWDAESQGQTSYNDGFSVDIVDANTGLSLLGLVYADCFTTTAAPGGCIDANGTLGGAETGVAGPEIFSGALPALPPTAYLSIVAWNGSDNAVAPAAAIDDITWTGGSNFTLGMSSPFGPGSLQIDNAGGTPLNSYITLLTVNQGNFPNGATAGIDITLGELLAQLAYGAAPFGGTLDVGGGSSFAVGPGIAPSGVTLYGVSGDIDPVVMFPVSVSPPISFMVP